MKGRGNGNLWLPHGPDIHLESHNEWLVPGSDTRLEPGLIEL